MNVSVIVFSKDRACQLDLLMQSLLKYALPLWPPQVLFTASNNNFVDGYRLLREYYPWLKFLHPQEHFQRDLFALMNRYSALTMFLVDDDVFFRPLPPIPEIPPGHAYAPRLGKNCTYCFNVDKPQKEGELDFDATCILDGAIYRTEEIYDRFKSLTFSNPNELEHRFCEGPQFKLIYPEHSVLCGIPHNRVQDQYANRTMGGSAAELNERFLRGERIDLDAMNFENVNSAHMPIEYVWRKT